ncbi:glucose-6-phosphate dehydrogenase [Phycisphaerales bacterium AB-hyl4]|uniref:Glucose-6-phosphate 1-dehydrogenase n=1 Tax=Natronomicrosphaera hydrolytica TaxID=3242702 RepID=A0ABV4U3I4_9BACT
MPSRTAASDCLIVIFGASGDLTKRKLIPALYDLYHAKLLTNNFAVMGISRTSYSDDQFRDYLKKHAKQFSKHFDEQTWKEFAPRLHYHAGDSTKSEAFPEIKSRMCELAAEHDTGDNSLFYLSVAPRLYDSIIENIGRHDMVTEGRAWCSINREQQSWQRIIVEKPFGRDLKSAAHLNRVLGRVFEDDSVFRIDHYLGKETVQNLMVFRFANAIFEPIWNRTYIDHVQITAAETVGVEGRGGYYDGPDGGAMRDMIQSHLLNVMALVAMEPPVTMRADHIRQENTKVLTAVREIRPEVVSKAAVRGQYVAGSHGGKPAIGFLEEEGVDAGSRTETYAALQVFVDNWRWQGVPFYLRSGKRLPAKTTEIVVYFKPTPHSLFRGVSGMNDLTPNQIVINVQPDEGIRLRFEGKVPGIGMKIKSVVMDFDYAEQFQADPPEAYATLLLDAMRGDQTLYKQREEIEQAWRIVQPVLDAWEANRDETIPTYPAGSWGPPAADIMLARDSRHWRIP